MPTGIKVIPNATVLPEQILTYFGIGIDENNKCVCPFHDDSNPSMQINETYVYCHGCKWSGDTWKLAEELLAKNNKDIYISSFLRHTSFPSPSGRIYKVSEYSGEVPDNLINAWHVALLNNKEALRKLTAERQISLETVNKFKLGWRQDKRAYVIPYIYRNKADIVQFRSTTTNESGSKYWGLSGHNRGSIINREILDTPQEYVVILMGAFDALLASQDGIPAVGINGSFPFKKIEKERVQEMFSKQSLIFIVPDNNPEEHKAARKLAEWLNAEVRYFDEDYEHNLDYIDYRNLGKTAEDFKREVLGILPYEDLKETQLFPSLCALYDVGNGYEFATVYVEMLAKGVAWQDAGIMMANHHVTDKTSKRQMYNVKNKGDFIAAMRYNFGKPKKGIW